MTSRYDVEVDPNATNSPHAAAIRFVGRNHRVLEVGCAAGHVSRHLIERGNEVVGIEIDPEAADRAREFVPEVHVADVDIVRPSSLVEGTFDVVLLGDVLEHLRDPIAVLRDVVALLGPEGRLVISLPNVAHVDVRAMLLRGEWRYQDVGILDRTHLRWFTRDSVRELLAEVGFVAVAVERMSAGFTGTNLAVPADAITPDIQRFVAADPDSETVQWVIEAAREGDDALALTEAIDWPDLAGERVRLEAELVATRAHRDALANEVDAWHRSRLVRYSAPLRSGWAAVRRLAAR